jgi:hypothetical protein
LYAELVRVVFLVALVLALALVLLLAVRAEDELEAFLDDRELRVVRAELVRVQVFQMSCWTFSIQLVGRRSVRRETAAPTSSRTPS